MPDKTTDPNRGQGTEAAAGGSKNVSQGTASHVAADEKPKSYKGSRPYIFVSYSHKNEAQVLNIIRGLQNHGYRVFYDEGIATGSDWDEYLATRIENCNCICAVFSDEYWASDICQNELRMAISDCKKPHLGVHLRKHEIPSAFKLIRGSVQDVFLYEYNDYYKFLEKLCSSPIFSECRRDPSEAAEEEEAEDKFFRTHAHASAGQQGARQQYTSSKKQAQIDEWLTNAKKFHVDGMDALAQETMNDVFNSADQAELDGDTFSLASEIYMANREYNSAWATINQAITRDPDNYDYYNAKGQMWLEMYEDPNFHVNNPKVDPDVESALKRALELETDPEAKSLSYGLYSKMCYCAGDERAADLAKKAVELGDSSGLGAEVARDLKRKKAEQKNDTFMPGALILFVIVEVLTIILIPAVGGIVGVIFIAVSIVTVAFMNYGAFAHSTGSYIAADIVISIVSFIVDILLFTNLYHDEEGFPNVVASVVIAVCFILAIVILSIAGHVQKRKALKK